jgi:MFS family permease
LNRRIPLATRSWEGTVISEPKQHPFFLGLLPLFVLAHFAHHLLTALPTPLLPFIRNDFNLNYTQSSLVVSAFSLSYGVSQLPAGWLADRIGPRMLITVGICGLSLAGVLVGLSHTYAMVIFFLVLMGVTAGGYHPAAAPLISRSVEPQRLGRALGFHLIGGGGSYFLAPLIASAIAAVWGWRGSFVGLAVPTVIFGVIFFKLLGRLSETRRTREARAEFSDGRQPGPVSGRLRRLVAFMVLSVFNAGLTTSAIIFVPLYLVDHFGASKQTAASFIAIAYSAGLWAGPAGGYLADRFGKIGIILVLSLLSGCMIYLLNLIPYGFGFGALLLMLGIIIFVRMAVSEAYIMGQTTERYRSTVYGIYYCSMTESGALLAPVMGYLIDRLGFYYCFTIAGVAAVVITPICAAFLWGGRN